MKNPLRRRWRNEAGAVLVFVALSMVVLLGIAALAIDVGYLYVVRGELQNAADSGALAAAQVLYNDDGQEVNTGANAVGRTYVQQHIADADKGIVQIATGCTAQLDEEGTCVERGHWSFQTKTFTPNSSLRPPQLWNKTTQELDIYNPDEPFINAVRVITTRASKTVNGKAAALNEPWLARTFGGLGPVLKATAVAYIGFAGKLKPFEVDQPIAICKQALLATGEYTCTVGRMLNSDTGGGAGYDTYSGTGGWTDFNQPDQPWPACAGGASSKQEIDDAICRGNSQPLLLGYGMSTQNGVVDGTFRGLMNDCWKSEPSIDRYPQGAGDHIPDQPWSITLPVIDCEGGHPTSCARVVGAVTVDVVWMIRDQPVSSDKTNMTPKADDTPRRMGDWICDPKWDDRQCWVDFVTHFNLKAPDGSPAIASKKTIYFLPSCTPHEPAGTTGGENFGILAKIPVLVQ